MRILNVVIALFQNIFLALGDRQAAQRCPGMSLSQCG
jgi:hypothetical protein